MPRKTYTPEFRAQLVALVRQGRTPEPLAREYEPSAPTIRDWVETANGAATAPPDKDARIRELERELAYVREEREILKKAAAWFAMEGGLIRKTDTRS